MKLSVKKRTWNYLLKMNMKFEHAECISSKNENINFLTKLLNVQLFMHAGVRVK